MLLLSLFFCDILIGIFIIIPYQKDNTAALSLCNMLLIHCHVHILWGCDRY